MHQQLAGAAAAAIHTRFCGLFHDGEAEPLKLLRMREATLRSCGLSRAKIASIRDLAAHTVNGSIPTLAELRRIDDEDVIERLTVVRGIGPWTVQMLLMFHLGRPDVLPTADYGVRKGFARVYSKRALPSEKALLRHGEKWRPYRSYASWCFWRALEQPQEE
jgi:DNA-3-methyladenine glycosylase II